ncbi:hypothetical protein RHGRI_007197 [Rhododendron griersonianum]|uniref:Uncharacterized protein n=1 Tax=Rhododendron griersonianum TaxID=479676 RepID=A0AAV6KWN9_9ERIC|nr:hypothetical protein RHGRI_007197 [Rhododendron griersonianum]
MVRTKHVGVRVRGKGKGVASSSRKEEEIVEESEHDLMEEDSDEDSAPLESRTGKREKRRKRRTPEEMEADAELDWVESIPNRGFKSEQQISRRRFGNNSDIIIQLKNQGLLFWTKSLAGYNEKGVIEFYQKLETSEALIEEKIKSKVNGKTIVADVVAIAKYLRYERPAGDLINYPRAEFRFILFIHHQWTAQGSLLDWIDSYTSHTILLIYNGKRDLDKVTLYHGRTPHP